jgi:hypothetical protein
VDPEAPALAFVGRGELTGTQVVERARSDAATRGLTPVSRLLSGLPYDSWDGLSAGLLAPLAAGGSVVLCRHLEKLAPEALDQRRESERVTTTAV